MRAESLEDLELYVDTMRDALARCLDDSRGHGEKTACKAMRGWRELRAMVITSSKLKAINVTVQSCAVTSTGTCHTGTSESLDPPSSVTPFNYPRIFC